MMDNYRRSWALRYLREAKAELEAARKMPYIAPSLLLEAMRKARNAIYYSLGEPAFIENILKETSEKTQGIESPVLRCLIGIEETVQELTQLKQADGEIAMKQADSLVQLAADIVETLTGEEIEE
ncbi:hypothetical protein E3J49_01230 [Candidatus Bathyarchaeota archaeon]|nr:MAG: hypothetical protein E3J49_01230 [Candidatus Bathyarchaeota archaeon]